ncbi:MAG: sulfotransferase family protein [Candidatus Hydrogenedens sp.]|nr:sulfotransferase family 2 domain-containing protein [Candidatus Hydrogenedentota bacterium]NLF57872.1 sulfotransferase family protein [Candidatus Hydrogenedens sp.]
MVINSDKRFVFVHVPKAAGTSLAAVLAALPGNRPEWTNPQTKHETLPELLRECRGRWGFRERILVRNFRKYLAFGFVRNPWDRVASLHAYLCEKRPRKEIDAVESFDHFLRLADRGEPWILGMHTMRPQMDFFPRAFNAFAAVFVGHYEHFQEDLATVTGRLGVAVELPRLNVSSNSRRDYRLQYNGGQADIVARLFAADCKLFGYAFDEPGPSKRLSRWLHEPPTA